MQLDQLLEFFAASPAVRLLRSPHAPYVIHFLDRTFKQSERSCLPHGELAAELHLFQKQIHTHLDRLASDPSRASAQSLATAQLAATNLAATNLAATHVASGPLAGRAEEYLGDWCAAESRWLVRRLEIDNDQPVYELSPETEMVLRFVREGTRRGREFVATESRLRRIVEALSSLVVGANDDPDRRLQHLRQQRDQIDAEIEAIESDGRVNKLNPTAIRERFSGAVEDLVHLQSDFRAVEESFVQITRRVQQRNGESNASRAEILEDALDAEDALKSSDQGVSFYEFVKQILAPDQQEQLETLIARLEQIPEISGRSEELGRIDRMVPSLLVEAQKVLRTTHRLSASLRRLVDNRNCHRRARLTGLLGDIRNLAVQLSDSPPIDSVGLSLDTDLALNAPLERAFWSPPQTFDTGRVREDCPDEDDRLTAFKSLALMRRLDWSGMRRRITTELAQRDALPLREMLQKTPPPGGAFEILGYLQIAHDDGHTIEATETDRVEIAHSTSTDVDPRRAIAWLRYPGEIRIGQVDQDLSIPAQPNQNRLDDHEPDRNEADAEVGGQRQRRWVLEIPRVVFTKAAAQSRGGRVDPK
jgi:hypothetical protein